MVPEPNCPEKALVGHIAPPDVWPRGLLSHIERKAL
jgi:hypothetical protein